MRKLRDSRSYLLHRKNQKIRNSLQEEIQGRNIISYHPKIIKEEQAKRTPTKTETTSPNQEDLKNKLTQKNTRTTQKATNPLGNKAPTWRATPNNCHSVNSNRIRPPKIMRMHRCGRIEKSSKGIGLYKPSSKQGDHWC
jgi:hypothetical protein